MIILRQKARNQFLFLVRKAKHDCSCRAKKLALTFYGHSSLYYDTETDSSTPETHHILVEQNYLKMFIQTYSHIFMYGILLILLVHINDKHYAKIQLYRG